MVLKLLKEQFNRVTRNNEQEHLETSSHQTYNFDAPIDLDKPVKSNTNATSSRFDTDNSFK